MATPPPLKFTVRGPEGLSLLCGPPFNGEPASTIEKIPCSASKFSEDGTRLAVTTPDAVIIYDTDTGKEVMKIAAAGVSSTAFSPLGTYLQTFQKPQGQQKNLSLWDLKTGAVVFQQFQKIITKATWPVIQFSDDESVACRLVTNEAHLFDGHDFSKGIKDKLRLPGIDGVSLAHSPASHIAAYVPEIKGAPANVKLFEVANVSQAEPVARRSFFKSNTAQLMWNKGSTGVLVLATSDVDKTNQNYYGESRLHFLTSDGRHEGAVPLSKEGPIYDAQWSPNGKEFLVVYGYMPAKVTLFNNVCKPIHELGQGPYNTLRWNPQGSFFCLAGFGNLPGDVAFWHRETLKSFQKIRAPVSVTCEWSADGRYFMTATTAPRLQVDNGLTVFRYDGTLHYQKKYDKLYQVEWRPAASGVYPDRPPSPGARKPESKVEAPKTAQPSTGTKPGAYRPPHAGQSAATKAMLFGLDEPSSNAGAGGSAGLSKSALKNQKRRQKKKEEGGAS